MLEFIPFCMKLLDTEDKSICPKSSPKTKGDSPYLCISLFSWEFILVEIEPKCKSRLRDDKQGLIPWNLPNGIKLFPAFITRKIRMNSKPRFSEVFYVTSTQGSFISEQGSALTLDFKVQHV